LIPGNSTAYAAGAKKRPQTVAGGDLFRVNAPEPKSSCNALVKFLPAFIRQLSPRMLSTLLMDASILCGTFLVARAFQGGIFDTTAAAAYLCIFLAAGMQEGLYSQNQRNASTQFLFAKTSVWASLVTILLLQRTGRGAVGIALLAFGSACVSCAWRWGWGKATESGADWRRNVLLVGDPARMQAVAVALRSDPNSGRCVEGMFPDWQLYEVHGFDLLRVLAREKHIDEVVLVSHAPDLARSVLSECSRNSLNLLIVPEIPEGRLLDIENLEGAPLLKIHEHLPPEWRLTVKRVIDAVLAAVGLILAFPPMCLMAVAIKLESHGPFLYRAARIGLAGGSSHTDTYVANLRTHENDRIRLLNWLSGDALAEVLTNAALFVLPSDMEGLSLALLDAMGAGVCVLASDTPENREVISDAGFTFRRGDKDHLRQMITMLIADADLRSAVGKKAQQRIQREYLWDGVTQHLEQMYLELATPKGTRAHEATRAAVGGKAA